MKKRSVRSAVISFLIILSIMSFSSASTNVIVYEYNDANQLVQIKTGDGIAKFNLKYDANGNMKEILDGELLINVNNGDHTSPSNEPVTVSVVNGNSSGYKYKLLTKDGTGAWKTEVELSEKSNFSFTRSQPVEVSVKVVAQSGGSVIESDVEVINFHEPFRLNRFKKIVSTTPRNKINFDIDATGTNLEYKFYVKKGTGAWSLHKTTNDPKTIEYVSKEYKIDCQFKLEVKDQFEENTKYLLENHTFNLTYLTLNSVNYEVVKDPFTNENKSIKINVNATGEPFLKYSCRIEDLNGQIDFRQYNSTGKFLWTPENDISYRVYITVYDYVNTTRSHSETYQVEGFVDDIEIANIEIKDVKINSNENANGTLTLDDNQFGVNVVYVNGSNPLFEIKLRKPGSSYFSTLKSYSSSSRTGFEVTKTGYYYIRVRVKDDNNSTPIERVVSKYITYRSSGSGSGGGITLPVEPPGGEEAF